MYSKKQIIEKMKSWKTTVLGIIAGFTYAFASGAMACVGNGQVDFDCLTKLAFSAIIATALYYCKDYNVTGVKCLAFLFCMGAGLNSYSQANGSITTDNQRYHNSFIPTAEPNGAIQFNYYGSLGTDTTKVFLDTLLRIVVDETPVAVNPLQSKPHGKGINIVEGDSGTFGGFSYTKQTNTLSLYGAKTGSQFSFNVSPTGISFTDSSGGTVSVGGSGQYTPDTANAINCVVNSVLPTNYIITDSVISVTGIVQVTSTDSLTENSFQLDAPVDDVINGLYGIANVVSISQYVDGNGYCFGNAGRVSIAFYSSRKATVLIPYTYNYRYK